MLINCYYVSFPNVANRWFYFSKWKGSCHERDIVVIAYSLKMYLYVDVHVSL